MNDKYNRRTLALVVAALALSVAVSADVMIHWWTIDGGGAMASTGGDFELSGTIGQPDAGVMTGGDFELTGGFWRPASRALEPHKVPSGEGEPLDDDFEQAEEQPLPPP